MISNLRHCGAALVFSLKPSYFNTKFKRSDIPEIQALIGPITIDHKTGKTVYPRIPSFACANGEPSDMLSRFRSKYLYRVCKQFGTFFLQSCADSFFIQLARFIIFGTTSVDSVDSATGRSSSTYLCSGQRAKTTFGLISAIVTAVCLISSLRSQ